MTRKRIPDTEYAKVVTKNAGVCCVCKVRGIGVNLHHIDLNPANNDTKNLAVLCVREHDAHHRPTQYPALNHIDLAPTAIHKYKQEWEAFVEEAQKPQPNILAVINAYGTVEEVHSMRLLFQWSLGKIVFERVYHLLDGPVASWVDAALEEVQWLGQNIRVVPVGALLSVDHCPNCARGLSNTIDTNYATRLTAIDWDTQSIGSIYINPVQSSLAVNITYRGETIGAASLHRCSNNLHFICDNYEERSLIRSRIGVRTQVSKIVNKYLSDWLPGTLLFATGNPDTPNIIQKMILPVIWEHPAV